MTRFLDWLLNRRPAPVPGTFSPELRARLLAVGMGNVNGGRR